MDNRGELNKVAFSLVAKKAGHDSGRYCTVLDDCEIEMCACLVANRHMCSEKQRKKDAKKGRIIASSFVYLPQDDELITMKPDRECA